MAMKRIINPYEGMSREEGYHCFACAPNNEHGLHMEFYEDGDEVVCFWTPEEHFQGWTNTLHGGIQATLIDETAGWVIARKLQTSGMTTNLNIKYKRPIPTIEGTKVEIRAYIREKKRNFALMEASIQCDGELCTTAELTFYCFTQEKAKEEFHFMPYEVEDSNE